MPQDMVGPDYVAPNDEMLEMIRKHRDDPSPFDTPSDESVIHMLLPVLAGQAADFLSTEKPAGFLRLEGMHEGNPLPGMNAGGVGGTASRLGYSGIEAALIAALLKKYPKIGRGAARVSGSSHMGYALQNSKQADRISRLNQEGVNWEAKDSW